MPIGFDVQARADQRSFDRVADQAQSRFDKAGRESGTAFAKSLDDAVSKADPKSAERWTRAFDRVADATGKVRAEEAKLQELRNKGASDARLITQSESLERARRAETRATNDAARAYQDLGSRGQGLLSTLANLGSGTRFGGLIADTEMLAGKFGGVGLAVGGTITAVAGLAVGIGAAATKLYELGSRWDDIADGITARTGKMGADLQGVMDQVSSVALDSSASIGQIGDIAGRVSASIGATGDHLGELTAYIADLNDMTGETTNIRNLAMLYNVFKVEGEDQITVLNDLYNTYTKTQIPINELIDTLVSAGPKVSQFGLDLGQTAGLITSFTEAGVPAESAIKGLQTALKNFADSGQDPKQALTEVIAKIRELHDAGNDPAARQLALDAFGAKNFAPFLEAIESGKVGTRQLSENLQQNDLDIRTVKASTDDFSQQWQRFKNFLEVDLQPIATAVFDGLNTQLEWFADSMHSTIEGLKDAWHWLEDLIGGSNVLGSTAPPWAQPGTPYTGGPGIFGGQGSATGGNPLNPGGIYGPNAAGSPGRGFPLPWTLPPLAAGSSPREFANQSMMPFWQSQGYTVGDHAADQYGEHQNGALDIMVPSIEAGSRVLQQVLSDPNVYGAIFNNQVFGYGQGPGPRDYTAGHTGNPTQDHQDHVHVWYKPGGNNNIAPAGSAATLTSAQGPMMFGPQSPAGPFGPGYQPSPIGGTPGYNDSGTPGYYVPDPTRIRGAGERVQDVQDSIARADQRIADIKESIGDANDAILEANENQIAAIQKAAEIEASYTATEEQKRSAARQVEQANKARERAIEQRDRIVGRDLPDAMAARDRLENRDLRDAREAEAEARRGQFRSAQKVPGMSSSGGGMRGGIGQIGAPIAGDFGFSGGLPGIAENLTNFMANLGFAPALGALSGLGMAMDPFGRAQGGGGLIGMGAALSGLGGFGAPSTVNGGITPSSIGGGGLGGGGGGIPGLSNIFGGPLGPAPGPGGVGGAAATPTTLGGTSPGPGAGGGGFGGAGGTGVGGMAMQGIQAGISAAGLALDSMAPGAGTAAAMAANMGVQLGNRAIGQLGKAAGITVGGLMETFLPSNSKLADPSANWFGRIAGGFAGAKPALPNMTGQPADKPASQQPDPLADPAAAAGATQNGQSSSSSGGITVNYTNNQATEDRAGADLTTHLMAMNGTPGW